MMLQCYEGIEVIVAFIRNKFQKLINSTNCNTKNSYERLIYLVANKGNNTQQHLRNMPTQYRNFVERSITKFLMKASLAKVTSKIICSLHLWHRWWDRSLHQKQVPRTSMLREKWHLTVCYRWTPPDLLDSCSIVSSYHFFCSRKVREATISSKLRTTSTVTTSRSFPTLGDP